MTQQRRIRGTLATGRTFDMAYLAAGRAFDMAYQWVNELTRTTSQNKMTEYNYNFTKCEYFSETYASMENTIQKNIVATQYWTHLAQPNYTPIRPDQPNLGIQHQTDVCKLQLSHIILSQELFDEWGNLSKTQVYQWCFVLVRQQVI
jgi:hypothetical protein